jgi:hypothetical protein
MATVAAILAGGTSVIPATWLHPAAAQGNPKLSNIVPPSAEMTILAKITAINPNTREVTLQGRSGNTVTMTAGPIVRLDKLKVGDVVNAKYYRSVAFEMSGPQGGNATPQSNNQQEQAVAQLAEAPGGIAVRETKVSGLVVAIDMAAHSVDLVNPSGGGIHTVEVTDPDRIAMLSQVKVGDTITAVVSETLAVSIEPASTSLF